MTRPISLAALSAFLLASGGPPADQAGHPATAAFEKVATLQVPQLRWNPLAAKGPERAKRLPEIVPLGHAESAAAVVTTERVLLLDAAATGVRDVFEIPRITALFAHRGNDLELYLLQGVLEERRLSRLDPETGKLAWSVPAPVRGSFIANGVRYAVPILFRRMQEPQQVFLAGLHHDRGFQRLPQHRLSWVDAATGTVERQADFSFRRPIGRLALASEEGPALTLAELFLFVDETSRHFEVIDVSNGEVLIAGELEPGDLVVDVGQGKTLPVGTWDSSPDSFRFWELAAFLSPTGPVITSHRYNNSGVKVFWTGSWVQFDMDGQRLGRIEEPPGLEGSGGSLMIRNFEGSRWPLLFASLNRRQGLEKHLFVLNGEGNLSSAPLPPSQRQGGPWFTLDRDRWFHDGERVYFLQPGGKGLLTGPGSSQLFCWPIGGTDLSVAYTSELGVAYDKVLSADSRYVALASDDSARLVRLADGSVVPPEEYGDGLGTDLWKQVLDYDRLHTRALPEGTPPHQRFGRIPTGYVSGTSIEVFGLESPVWNGLRVWDEFGERGALGDLVLFPLVMGDGSGRLVGVALPQNRVVFELPILRVKALPPSFSADGFFFGVVARQEEEATLLVFEKPQQLAVYRLRRPTHARKLTVVPRR